MLLVLRRLRTVLVMPLCVAAVALLEAVCCCMLAAVPQVLAAMLVCAAAMPVLDATEATLLSAVAAVELEAVLLVCALLTRLALVI